MPVSMNAVESGIIPAMSTTVVHEIDRYACAGVTVRVTTSAPAASRPATAGGTIPVASSATIAARMTIARVAPRPSGTRPAQLLGESTTRPPDASACMVRSSHEPCSSSASPATTVMSWPFSSLSPRRRGEDHQLAVGRGHARIDLACR